MSDSPPGSIRPSLAWEVGTGALLLVTAGSGVLVVLSVALGLAVQDYLGSDADMSPLLTWLYENPDRAYGIDALGLLLTFASIVGFFVWRYRTRALLRRYGLDPVSLTRHPGVVTWGVATFMAYCCAGGLVEPGTYDSVDGMVDLLQIVVFSGVLRLVGLAGLMIAVWQIRRRVHLSLGAYFPPAFTPPSPYAATPYTALPPYTATPPYPATPPPPYAAVTTPPVTPPAPADGIPGIGDLPVADDDFWHRVRQAAADTELALLETSGPGLHRWVLIPAGRELDAVRASLAPGAAITVFTEPPVRRETNGYRPPEAAEYHGLLESAVTGALRHQSVGPRSLLSFLDRAETGGRWALYPVGDPNALAARLP
ncbi:hypothetical protein [Actinoplanes xinjiangensis]|uniref:hypothetical protein n=1 Tax=Actinoplanes xinjiangensis TaxID=512350 RepID=UPI0034277353